MPAVSLPNSTRLHSESPKPTCSAKVWGSPHRRSASAAAIVHTPNGDTITLFNPRIVETGGGEDEQYEGCLSFFDLRGQVPRPLTIHVEHTDIDGNTRITVCERRVARLVRD